MANSHKGNAAKKRSRIAYNLQQRDIKNKRRKLVKHKKGKKDIKMDVEAIMGSYIKNRKQGKTTK